ncbi:MAG: hypothetical protein PIR02_02590 [Microbacterium enclense]
MTATDFAAPPAPVVEVEALGVRIDVRVRSEISESGRRLIRDAWRDCRGGSTTEPLRRTLELPASMFDDLERGLSDLSTQVTLEALQALRGTRLLLHAAAVATADGRVIAFIGPSGRGKTTAARHLGRHFAYVSDESVAVGDDLSVTAYRKPLSVIIEGHAHKRQIAPSEFGLRPLPDAPLHLVGMTLIERRPDTDAIGLVPVDTIDAICEMTPQISYLAEMPSPLQHLARVFDAVGAPSRLVYRDATELPALVEEMFASTPVPAPAWTVPSPANGDDSWKVAPVDDAIIVDGRACILRDGVVTALDQRGRLAWCLAREGATAQQIADAAVGEFGVPPEGSALALIEQTLEDLRGHGLLESA